MSDFPNGYLTTGNKPVINDVYKEAEKYLKEQRRQDSLYNDEGDIYESAVIYAFIAGAKWQYKQFEKERLRHCDELTKEQAQIESDFVTQHLKHNNRTPTFIDAIEYGKRMTIDKACEWLNNFYSEDRDCYLVEEDIKAFRKAMEE